MTEKISQLSYDVLRKYREIGDDQNEFLNDRNSFLISKILDLITLLPFLAQSGREFELTSKIKLINGYLHLFGHWNDRTMENTSPTISGDFLSLSKSIEDRIRSSLVGKLRLRIYAIRKLNQYNMIMRLSFLQF